MVQKKNQIPSTVQNKNVEDDSSKKSSKRENSVNFFKESLQEDTDIVCDAQKLADENESEIFSIIKKDESKQYRDKIR